MTTRPQPLSARLRLVLVAVLTALAALLSPAALASASGLPAAQTRVGAIHPTVTTVVGVAEHIAAGQRRSRAPSQLRPAVGHCVAAEAGGSTSDLLSDLASKAQSTVGEGSGPVYGTAVHSAFAAEIDALGDSGLSTEVSYLDGRIVSYGTRGSVRLDVVEGDPLEPTAAYDLKTGSAAMTPSRIAEIQANLPPGYQDIPVSEVRP
jgi:hypothetical protein